jgi:hypothetical protein
VAAQLAASQEGLSSTSEITVEAVTASLNNKHKKDIIQISRLVYFKIN